MAEKPSKGGSPGKKGAKPPPAPVDRPSPVNPTDFPDKRQAGGKPPKAPVDRPPPPK